MPGSWFASRMIRASVYARSPFALEITERSAFTIVSDLIDVGYVIKDKRGNRNHYGIQEQLPLRESFGRQRTIGEILDLLAKASPRTLV